MSFKFFGTSEKFRCLLPLYIFTYAAYFEQPKTNYQSGAPNHHIILSLSDTGWFKMGNTEYEIKKGDILFFKSNIPCSYGSDSQWENSFISFNGYAAERLFEYFDFPDSFIFRDDSIAQKLKDICVSADNMVKEEKLSARLYSLINDIGLLINSSLIPEEFEKAAAFIRQNYQRDISLNDILEAAGTSHSTLYRQFFDFEKTTPVKFLNRLRIDAAKAYLEADSKSISEISRAVGFSSCNYFIETFKKLENITPLQYRKRK